jgi:dTDP-4-dehydrorhamnose 3,5-epimerase
LKFTPLSLSGAHLIEPVPIEDERGFFARIFCQETLRDQGLHADFAQCSISFNRLKGTLRGMHYQLEPQAEVKIVRCTQGEIYDVIIDVRRGSTTYGKWEGISLSAANRRLLYIPEGFAHGFQTLAENTEVFYQISRPYVPGYARGVRWNDPAFGIPWPMPVAVMSSKDQHYADFPS